jgi:16S rRNA (guanine966-N2)-methyltransferase
MSINILGGSYRGFSFVVSKHSTIRPTSVVLRRKMFDSNQNLEGFVFVDLCAGTGAMGIEALSRGAERVLLNEINPKEFKNLKENITNISNKFDVSHQISLNKGDALKYIDRFLLDYSSFDADQKRNTILYFDPPYELLDLYEEFCKKMKESPQYIGQIWIEADRQKTFPLESMENKLEYKHKSYIQGTSYICVFKR